MDSVVQGVEQYDQAQFAPLQTLVCKFNRGLPWYIVTFATSFS